MPETLQSDKEITEEIAPKAELMDAETTVQIDVAKAEAAKAEIEAETDRARNYSFLQRNPQTLDAVVVGDTSYVIPAVMGSIYWAILKVCYEKVNCPVYFDELLDGVASLIQDRNPDDWDKIISKKQTNAHHKSTGKSEMQDTKTWQERIINNAKTLTRWKDYGKRLHERGHVLTFGYDADMKPCFTLHTNLDVLSQPKSRAPRKAKAEKTTVEKPEKKEKKVKKAAK